MKVKSVKLMGVLICAALAWTACADDPSDLPEATGPVVLEIDKSSLVIGESLFFYGQNLGEGDTERTRLTFVGTFFADDGSQSEVDLTITPLEDGFIAPASNPRGEATLNVLRWSRFGPFENPFGINATGVFRGTVRATVVKSDGSEVVGPASRTFELGVEPSIVIEQLEPVIANCDAPALRGLEGLPYDLKVRAVGFTPTSFRYEISNINNSPGVTVFEHTAAGPTDTLGQDEPFVLNPVSMASADPGAPVASYVTEIRVIATDTKGQVVETVLPFSVHRPMEIFFSNKLEIAEYLDPVPVTSCIPGSIGNRVSYSETTSETRQQSVSVTVSSQWSRANSTSTSEGWQEGISEGFTQSQNFSQSSSISEGSNTSETYGVNYNSSNSNSVGFSSSDGENWGWNVAEGVTDQESLSRMNQLSGEVGLSSTVTVGAEGSVPGFAKASGSVAVQGSVKVGATTGTTEGRSRSNSRNQGYSSGGSSSNTESFGSTTTDSAGQSMSGTYALSRNITNSTNISDSESRSRSRTYNMNGSVTEGTVVSEGLSEAESQTWSESSTQSTLIGFSGVIPNGRKGVFYRQTVRSVRRAQMRSYDLCGISSLQGEMLFNEWTWAPALAIGDECGATLPQPDLPKAQCFIEPCVQ